MWWSDTLVAVIKFWVTHCQPEDSLNKVSCEDCILYCILSSNTLLSNLGCHLLTLPTADLTDPTLTLSVPLPTGGAALTGVAAQ